MTTPTRKESNKVNAWQVIVVALYLMGTFAWGIMHTRDILADDSASATFENPRVNLLCSYWYEGFNYRDVMSEISFPVSVGVTDKMSTGVYGSLYKVRISDNSPCILSAYPIPGAMRVSDKPGFLNLYRRVSQ